VAAPDHVWWVWLVWLVVWGSSVLVGKRVNRGDAQW